MRLEEHRVEQLHQRHVKHVEPVGAGAALVAVAMPAPVRRQHHVARHHGEPLAVHHRVGAGLGVDHEPQRVRRVAVRARLLARHDHLVGGDDGARGGVAGRRILQDQVAALGELGVDQPAGGVERALGLVVVPAMRLERLLRLGPQRRRGLGPAGHHHDRRELAVEFLKRGRLRELLWGGCGHVELPGWWVQAYTQSKALPRRCGAVRAWQHGPAP